MSVLTAENICVSHDGRQVLSNVSFGVDRGDWLCILGGSGAGKSCLIRAVLKLTEIDSGRITYGEGIMPTTVGYLPQHADASPAMPQTVREIVSGGLITKKHFFLHMSRGDKMRVNAIINALEMDDIADRRFVDLSGGQKQKVMLARAFCASNGLIALDEPVAGLDAIASANLYRMVRQINQNGTTVIMASNNEQEALMYSSHILCLDGANVFFGRTIDYIKDRKH